VASGLLGLRRLFAAYNDATRVAHGVEQLLEQGGASEAAPEGGEGRSAPPLRASKRSKHERAAQSTGVSTGRGNTTTQAGPWSSSHLADTQQSGPGLDSEFSTAAAASGHILIVSGGGGAKARRRRKVDTLAILQRLQSEHAAASRKSSCHVAGPVGERQGKRRAMQAPGARPAAHIAEVPGCDRPALIGLSHPPLYCAFNPFLLDPEEMEEERQRLAAKLSTGLVAGVYVQIGALVAEQPQGQCHNARRACFPG
jgi:hypothetical protein